MSRKILKRSLALGALMAFVITGNALAANMTNQTQANEIKEDTVNYVVDGAITATGSDIVINGNKDATILTVNGGDIISYDKKGNLDNSVEDTGIGGDFRDTSYEKIEINNLKELNIKCNDIGIAAGNDADPSSDYMDRPKGKVYIKDTVAETNIEGGFAGVFAGGKNALVQIESQAVLIEGDYGVIGNAGSTINLGIETNKIGRLTIDADTCGLYGSGYSKINIFADSVSLTSERYGIYGKYSVINIGSADNMVDRISIATNSTPLHVESNNNEIQLYGKEVSLINNNGGNAIHLKPKGSVTMVKIVGDENLEIKGDIVNDTNINSTLNINSNVNDSLVTIEGNVISGTNGGLIDITLGAEGSYLKGKVTDSKGGITLNMNKGTIWEVTGDSKINKVTGEEGIVKVSEIGRVIANVTDGNEAKNFTLLGSSVAAENLDSENLAGELDKLKESVDGITFTGYKFEEGTALGEIEAYQENGEWKITEYTNVTNSNISDVVAHGLMAWRSEMNDMNKRLGELRNADGEHGVWVRMVRGESEYEAVKNQYNTYQLGYDEKLSVDKSWTVGMALTYTDGESGFNGGTAENQHKGFAVYGSKLNDDGSFIDLIAKYARLDHDIEVGTEKGDYDANGYSVSAEYGKRFQQGNGLWIEPQVELTYGQVGSADYMIGKNRAVVQEGMESLVGRIGFSLGKDIRDGNVYARASYLYDFEGETEASYTDAVGNRRYINDDLGGGWWEVGVGANINLSKATYIYADVEKTFGGEVDTNWQWNLGVRYSF